MNCSEFGAFLEGATSHVASEVEAARLHLASCVACRAKLLEVSEQTPGMPPGSEQKIVGRLQLDLKPVRPLPSTGRLTTAIVVLALLPTLAGVYLLGDKGLLAMHPLRATLIILVLALSFVWASAAVAKEMIPGQGDQTSSAGLVGSTVLAGTLLVIALAFRALPDPRFVRGGIPCYVQGSLCGLATAASAWLVVRRGYPLRAISLFGAFGLLGGLSGLIMLSVICPNISLGHIAVWHWTVALTGLLIGMGAGRLTATRRAIV